MVLYPISEPAPAPAPISEHHEAGLSRSRWSQSKGDAMAATARAGVVGGMRESGERKEESGGK